MSCEDPGQFRSLVAPHCTDLRSDQCSRALLKAGGAYGPGCLDLSIVASPELGMPPYRNYACPGATGALARLCGPPRVTAGTSASTSASTGTGASSGGSYGALAAGLGVTTTALGLTTAALYWKNTATTSSLEEARAQALRSMTAQKQTQQELQQQLTDAHEQLDGVTGDLIHVVSRANQSGFNEKITAITTYGRDALQADVRTRDLIT